jgi:hypothetical protein
MLSISASLKLSFFKILFWTIYRNETLDTMIYFAGVNTTVADYAFVVLLVVARISVVRLRGRTKWSL